MGNIYPAIGAFVQEEYMKKILCIIFMLALTVPAVVAGGRSDKRQGGKITIYTSMYEDVIEVLKKDLHKQFPKLNIEFIYGGTGQIQAKIAAEQAAGKLGCDILLVAEPPYSLELKENGILHSYKSTEASNLAFDHDPDGCWYPVRVSNMVLAYNPERNARNTIPHSFRDFAYDTSVRGSISMSNPLISGTTMATISALRDKYGIEYFAALGKQKVMIDTGAVALEKLEKGQCKVVMILEESVLKKREEEKSKLEIIYPTDGTVMIPSTIMIINNQWSSNRNTQAAEAITDWFLGSEGQNAIVAAWMHSVRTNFPKLPYDAIPTDEIRANSIPVNWENCFRQREEIQATFEDYVTNNR
jgi:iron(III) transport system substrate-binding protein